MADHFDRARFRNLKKTGRLAAGVGMHVERIVHGRDALRRKFGRALRQAAQIVHLLRSQKLIGIGPTLHALRRPHFDEAAARFEHVQFLAMLHAAHHRRFRSQILTQIQRGGSGESDAGGRLRWMRTAGAQQKRERDQPMPNSSTRSSGVPQRRQIRDAQSPHTSGSSTGCRHAGQ